MQTQCSSGIPIVRLVILLAASMLLQSSHAHAQASIEHADTRELVALVKDASDLVRTRGEAAFSEFRTPDTRWRQREQYVFVLDTQGNMLVHFDPAMENKNQLNLRDVNAKLIIRGLIGAVTTVPAKTEGWYHYEWPVPGGILPRWKSSYVQLVKAPSGKSYVVGSGIYNDRMEKVFVENMVNDAIAEIERNGERAFQLFHDPTGPFIAKDAYIFVYDMNGTNLVLPAFPNLEKRNLSEFKDTQGKLVIREMLDQVQTKGSGWIDYMWPKPGERGSFVFLDTYVFVSTPDGTELVNGGHPSLEGRNIIDLKDVKGTPIARNFIATAMKDGKGWESYYWYRPGESTPVRKQTYVRKVQSGNVTYIVGSGFYVADETTSRMGLHE